MLLLCLFCISSLANISVCCISQSKGKPRFTLPPAGSAVDGKSDCSSDVCGLLQTPIGPLSACQRNSIHVRFQRGGGRGSVTPPSLKNHKNIGFPSNTDPLKITKLPSQHSMWATIGPPAKRHFNGVFLAGR